MQIKLSDFRYFLIDIMSYIQYNITNPEYMLKYFTNNISKRRNK